MKNILIINTEKENSYWIDYFDYLKDRSCNLFLLSNDPLLSSHFFEKKLYHKKININIDPTKKLLNSFLFTIFRPISFTVIFFLLLYFKFKKKIDTLICFNYFEKIYFTRPAKWLGLKVVWVKTPTPITALPKYAIRKVKKLSKLARLIVFSESYKNKLIGIGIKDNIEILDIGIKRAKSAEQKSIFQSIAQNTTEENYKKFFTVGTIQDLSGDVTHIEKLLNATKNCLDVIPHIQLIVAGH